MTRLSIGRFITTLLLVSMIRPDFNGEVRANQLTDMNESSSIHQQDDNNQSNLPPGFQINSSTPRTLVLDIQAPSYIFVSALSEDKSCKIVKADGYFQTSLPGEPGIPSAGVMIGIPPDSSPSFTIRSIETIDLPGQIHLCPVATPVIHHDSHGLVVYQGEVLLENSSIYAQDAFLPSQPVELVSSGMIRDQRVARLNFSPFQYNSAIDELRFISHIRIEIQLGKYDSFSTSSMPVEEGPFEPLLMKTLINYNQARLWRIPRQSETPEPAESTSSLPTNQVSFKIQVDQDGLYQLSYTALQSSGVPVDDLDPRTFRLLNQGIDIPVVVFGEEDGVFNPEDYLLFYGQKGVTKYTNSNIYWIIWGGENGLRMATQDGTVHVAPSPEWFRTTLHLEQDQQYYSASPSGILHDHWYWTYLNAYNGPFSHDFSFTLQNLSESPLNARISGLLKGLYADPEHHTRLYLNGHLLDDQTWHSTDDYSFSIDFSPSYLNEGANTITIECPLDGEITIDRVLVNWFEIDYYRTYMSENNLLSFAGDQVGLWQFQIGGFNSDTIDIFDISDPTAPARIVDATIVPYEPLYQVNFEQQVNGENRYLALSPSSWLAPVAITQDIPSNLKDPTNRADYIIISYADFLDDIQPLAAYRANQGIRVKVVDVQDVYDEFSGGAFNPKAIQNFLAYAYSYWIAPAPSYVLLVGDGHYDYKNDYGDSGPNYLPPFLGEFDPWIGETVSDNRFVLVSGEDILPDMAIGRLPANSSEEVTAMVNKILSYEQSPTNGIWNMKLSFVADDADAGGNFPELANNIADNHLPDTYIAEKIYYGISPYTSVADARASILNAINEGRLMVSFIGHGSVQFWAAESLFSVNSITSLTDNGIYPFFASLTCSEGYFIYPISQGYNYPSLAESLVRVGDKGVIASFSPSGFGLANGHDILAQGLYTAFFFDGITQFGPATTYSKYFLYENGPGYMDLVDTYNLLGDPATRLNVTPMNLFFRLSLPIITR